MRRLIVIAALFATACSTFQGCDRGASGVGRGEVSPRPTPSSDDASTPSRDATAEADALVEAEQGSITIAVVSDLNGAYGSTEYGEPVHAAVRRIVELRPDVVLVVGDMVAGQRSGLDYRAMWRSFHAVVTEPLAAAGIPMAVTPGNHDASGYGEYADERSIYVDEWSSRRPQVDMLAGSSFPLRYGFMVGGVLFISLDATVIGPLPEDQLEWLRSQLESGRSSRPLVATVVFGHLPIHPVAIGRETEFLDDPRLESLLIAHDVDLYLSGHHHAFYPARRGELGLVAIGCLGGGNRPLLGTVDASPKTLVMLEVSPTGEVAVEAYTGPRFDRPLDWSTLPSQLGEGEHLLRRADPR